MLSVCESRGVRSVGVKKKEKKKEERLLLILSVKMNERMRIYHFSIIITTYTVLLKGVVVCSSLSWRIELGSILEGRLLLTQPVKMKEGRDITFL